MRRLLSLVLLAGCAGAPSTESETGRGDASTTQEVKATAQTEALTGVTLWHASKFGDSAMVQGLAADGRPITNFELRVVSTDRHVEILGTVPIGFQQRSGDGTLVYADGDPMVAAGRFFAETFGVMDGGGAGGGLQACNPTTGECEEWNPAREGAWPRQGTRDVTPPPHRPVDVNCSLCDPHDEAAEWTGCGGFLGLVQKCRPTSECNDGTSILCDETDCGVCGIGFLP